MSEEFDIQKTSQLARLEVTPEEAAEFAPQLETILAYIDSLRELDVSAVQASAHPSPLFATPRMDVPRSEEACLQSPLGGLEDNAPSFAQGQIKVPRVVES